MRAKLSWWAAFGGLVLFTALGCAKGTEGEDDGGSGGSGNAPLPGYDFRRPITITEGAPEGYAVFVDLEHAVLVSEDKSLEDGTDVRVCFETADGNIELDRAIDPRSAWNQATPTRIWFRVQPADPPGSYLLLYGNPNADPPPSNPSAIFDVFDDFEDGELDAAWTLSGIGGAGSGGAGGSGGDSGHGESAEETGGVVKFGGATQDIGGTADNFVFLSRQMSGNFVVDAEIKDTSGSLGGAAKMGGLMVRQGVEADAANMMITIQQTPRARVVSVRDSAGADTTANVTSDELNLPQLVSMQRNGQTVNTRYSDNGKSWTGLGMAATIAFTDPVEVGFPFANISGGAGFAHMDWVRIRPLVLPEPQASLGDEEPI